MRYLIASFLLLCAVAFLSANPPQRVRVVQANPFLATQFGTVTIPTYGAAYNGQISPEDFKALVDEIRLLRLAFERLTAAPNGTPAKATPTTDSVFAEGLAVLSNKCAKCHDKSVSATKGGPNKFTLLDGGKLASINTDQAFDCVLRIDDGTMPFNGPPLSDVETSKVFKMFRQMKAASAKGKK